MSGLLRKLLRGNRKSRAMSKLTAPPTKSRGDALRRRFRKLNQRLFKFESATWKPSSRSSQAQGNGPLPWRTLANPLNWFGWTGSFVLSWLLSRRYSMLAGAVPSLVGILFLAGVAAYAIVSDRGTRLSEYRALFDAAVELEDYSSALVTIGALVDQTPGNAELLYQQAVILDRSGRNAEALEHMQSIITAHNHPLAALWMISKECDLQLIEDWTPSEHDNFRRWMDVALSGVQGDNRTAAKILMSTYLVRIGANAEAIRFFEDIVLTRPELALTAASLCKSQFDLDRMKKFAAIAERLYTTQLAKVPSDTKTRIAYVQTLMLGDRDEQAAKVLNDGITLTKDPQLAQMLGAVLATWENRLKREDPGPRNFLKRLQVLQAAIGVSPNDAIVGQALIQLLVKARESSDASVVALRHAILKGDALAGSDFIQGTMALLSNDFEKSLVHLRRAAAQPAVPAMLNNLAVAISKTPGGNLEHALILSQEALNREPAHPYFRETRGQILLSLERWDDAIVDLENALDAKELQPLVLPSLAEAHRRLGNSEKADFYDERAQMITLRRD